jgi:hypothetical protein
VLRPLVSALAALLPLVTLYGAAPHGAAAERALTRAPLPTVSLGELRANPGPHLGQERRVVLQVARIGEPWQPWTTRFGPADYQRLEAWGDEQLPWRIADYDDPAPYLFTRRGSVAEFTLRLARPHDRFLATVAVREQFLREPWCEVLSLTRLDPAIGEGTVLHASNALRLQARGGLELALSELDRALGSPLPPHAAAELERLRREWTAQFERR